MIILLFLYSQAKSVILSCIQLGTQLQDLSISVSQTLLTNQKIPYPKVLFQKQPNILIMRKTHLFQPQKQITYTQKHSHIFFYHILYIYIFYFDSIHCTFVPYYLMKGSATSRGTLDALQVDPDDDASLPCLDHLPQKYSLVENMDTVSQRKKQQLPFSLPSRKFNQSTRDNLISNFTLNNGNINHLNDGENIIQRREMPVLKRLVRKNKIQRLVTNFIFKLKRTGISKQPAKLEFHYDRQSQFENAHPWKTWFRHTEGYSLSGWQLTLFVLVSTTSLVTLAIFYSLSIVFSEIDEYQNFLQLNQLIMVLSCILEIIIGFITKRYEDGRALVTLEEIATTYMKSNFWLDFIVLVFVLMDLISQNNSIESKALRFIILLKFGDCLRNLEMLENIYITTFIREQYWSLAIVFIINFTFAHILSILLNAMARLDTSENWLTVKRLDDSPWYQRYIWGYYWGTTTMLTVGFGDIAATTYKEAICLIFVEMISCISLAYNINCVGNLINNLRQEAKDKNKNMKTFQLMSKANNLSYELENKISNYIEESFLIKNKFNFTEEDSVLAFIPVSLRKEYLKQVNKKLFSHIPFLKNLTNVSQQAMAESIQRTIAHPEEIVFKKDQEARLLIIQNGSIGLTIRKNSTRSIMQNGIIVQKLSVREGEPSKILTLGFIKGKRLAYNVKSLTYSILYHFENEDLVNLLKQNSMDYEHYCLIKDKQELIVNCEELYPCELCPHENHYKFDCPRLHFYPNKVMVIFRYLRSLKFDLQERKHYNRKTKQMFQGLTNKSFLLEEMEQIRWEITSCNDLGSFAPSLRRLQNLERVETKTFEEGSEVKAGNENPIFNAQFVMDLVNNLQNKQEGFWTVETDEMHNWKHYFVTDNPQSLKNRKLFKKAKSKL